MNSLLFYLLLATVNARAIIKRRPVLMLYGDYGHLTVTSTGHIHTTNQRNSPSAALEFVNIGDNRFHMRSVSSGMFIAARRKRSKFVKLRGSSHEEEALVFSETTTRDKLNEYTVRVNGRQCPMIMRPNGTIGLKCSGRIRHSSFLPRRVHVKHLYTGTIN